jgi:hypothetical protein
MNAADMLNDSRLAIDILPVIVEALLYLGLAPIEMPTMTELYIWCL